ncbi:MAG: hypothetical protein MI923_17835, partial [Phycisphaerales bacterium]|nr:hypothetical protein [Phycisphaerales bacterium]
MRNQSKRLTAYSVVVAAALGLSACSATPNWANPVAWYDGIVGNDQGLPDKLPEGPDKDFPQLADVGQAPKPSLTVKERKQITEGLIADRNRQAYTGEILQGGTDPSAPPPPAAAPSSSFVGQPASPLNPEGAEDASGDI